MSATPATVTGRGQGRRVADLQGLDCHPLVTREAREEGSAALARLLWVARSPERRPPDPVRDVRLSGGERQLLAALAGTSGNAELAATLGVSVNTVKTRLRRLYRKLDVHTREEALRRGQ